MTYPLSYHASFHPSIHFSWFTHPLIRELINYFLQFFIHSFIYSSIYNHPFNWSKIYPFIASTIKWCTNHDSVNRSFRSCWGNSPHLTNQKQDEICALSNQETAFPYLAFLSSSHVWQCSPEKNSPTMLSSAETLNSMQLNLTSVEQGNTLKCWQNDEAVWINGCCWLD